MDFDGAYHALTLATSGTTVNPADLVLTHVPTQSHVIPRSVTSSAEYRSVGYPAANNRPQGAPRSHPLASIPPYTGHALGHIINEIPVGRFTGPPMPLGRMSRGSSIRCQWVLGDGLICDHMVTEGTIPEHLKEHGICNMHKCRIVQCHWRECGSHVKRESITRHVREVHLCSKRRSHRFLDHPRH